MKLFAIVALASYLAVTQAIHLPAFASPSADSAGSARPQCACEDRPGKYAGAMKAMGGKLTELATKLEDFGRDLTLAGNQVTSKEATDTATFARRISEMLKDISGERPAVILTALEGVNSFMGRVKETVHSLAVAGDAAVEAGSTTGPDGGLGAGYGPGSLVAKLNSLAMTVMGMEAIEKTVGSIAKHEGGVNA